MKDNYKRISKIYNLLSSVYSLGAVDRCREFALTEIKPGMKVCFLGVGQGQEAVRAIEMGAVVTVVDTSQSMLDEFKSRLGNGNLDTGVNIECRDVMDFCRQSSECSEKYDVVVAHFFLNVFPEVEMSKVLGGILGLCRDSGGVIIGDFWKDDKSSRVVKWVQMANWNIALFVFRRMADNPKHSIYIYDRLVEESGFSVVREKTFGSSAKFVGESWFRKLS